MFDKDHDKSASGTDLDARVAALPREVEPEVSLWGAIEQQLDVAVDDVDGEATTLPQKPGGGWYEMASAAAFAAATVAFIAFGTLTSDGNANPALARVAAFESGGQRGGDLIRVRQQMHGELRRALEELSPATRLVVVENLTRMEVARTEIESALEKEPGNRLLEQLLITSYTNELSLLNEFTGVARSAQQRTRL